MQELNKFIERYIATHYQSATDREKAIFRQAVQVGYEFANSPRIDWEQGILIESICVHDKEHMIFGYDQFGNYWEASGIYTDGELVKVNGAEIQENASPLN